MSQAGNVEAASREDRVWVFFFVLSLEEASLLLKIQTRVRVEKKINNTEKNPHTRATPSV